ncbi:hypothetical protein FSP39_006935, partial [Pinctada imbricata]
AERKTSLGKNWHPTCLKCQECGKVLTPGQHAEHKGMPYCHKPCYAAKFGPQMMGYGSNVASPANFRRGQHGTLYNGDVDFDMKKVYESPSPSSKTNRKSTSDINSNKDKVSGHRPKSENLQRTNNNIPNRFLDNDLTISTFCSMKENTVFTNFTYIPPVNFRQQLVQKIKDFNQFYEGKKRQPVVAKEEGDSLVIQGPLRIYWGVEQAIKFQQFDNVPAYPSPGPTNWRHSFMPGDNGPDISKEDIKKLQYEESPPTSPRVSRGIDDSMIFTPPEGVVMRKKNIRKFNTVAYRGDSRPNKWKRASINGHVYNFDTRVFTPMLGSCTSVTVDSKKTTDDVIRTLLEKFKIENKPNEFSLYMVSENEGETLLRTQDIPLLERIALGPDESSGCKLFLKDRIALPRKGSLVNFTVVEESEEPHTPDEITPVVPWSDPKEERLPAEIEQLVALPEPVLQGILRKFKEDEEIDVKTIKARYDLVRRKIRGQLEKLKSGASV